jgi:hypothetical protein
VRRFAGDSIPDRGQDRDYGCARDSSMTEGSLLTFGGASNTCQLIQRDKNVLIQRPYERYSGAGP